MKKKIIGHNFLHTHPITEKQLGLDDNHVIVDKNELDEVINFFNDYPEQIDKIGIRLSKLINSF